MTAFLEESWTFVDKAVGCIERLLGRGWTAADIGQPRGLSCAAGAFLLGRLLGAARLARCGGSRARDRARGAAAATLGGARRTLGGVAVRARSRQPAPQRKLDFIPGSIEWADFDPTATANAIYLLDVPEGLDRDGRRANVRQLSRRLAQPSAAATVASPNYTPYEIRIIGALVRLGRRDAALELLRFFLSDRRPPPWNQWPEIAWRDQQAPAHVGDLPHTWIAAEYVLAVRSLFAYEREADRIPGPRGGSGTRMDRGRGR